MRCLEAIRMPAWICSIERIPERMNSASHSRLALFSSPSVGHACRQAGKIPQRRPNSWSITSRVCGSIFTAFGAACWATGA
ncbi:hypothetical protein D9M68_825460 [compost metagenome]